MKRRLLIMVLALGLIVLLVACGDNGETADMSDVDRETAAQDNGDTTYDADANERDNVMTSTAVHQVDVMDLSNYFVIIDGTRIDFGTITVSELLDMKNLVWMDENISPEETFYAGGRFFGTIRIGTGDEGVMSLSIHNFTDNDIPAVDATITGATGTAGSPLTFEFMGGLVPGVSTKEDVLEVFAGTEGYTTSEDPARFRWEFSYINRDLNISLDIQVGVDVATGLLNRIRVVSNVPIPDGGI